MWNHSRSVKRVVFELPAVHACERHGIQHHVCDFYTCSEDRTIKMWDMVKYVHTQSISSDT
jgi:hypothetical protein